MRQERRGVLRKQGKTYFQTDYEIQFRPKRQVAPRSGVPGLSVEELLASIIHR